MYKRIKQIFLKKNDKIFVVNEPVILNGESQHIIFEEENSKPTNAYVLATQSEENFIKYQKYIYLQKQIIKELKNENIKLKNEKQNLNCKNKNLLYENNKLKIKLQIIKNQNNL